MQEEYDVLDHSYPASFISSDNVFFARLPLHSNDALLSSVRRFRDSVPKSERTKAGYIALIRNNFVQQTNNLIPLSRPCNACPRPPPPVI
jgi:hypothetical protein